MKPYVLPTETLQTIIYCNTLCTSTIQYTQWVSIPYLDLWGWGLDWWASYRRRGWMAEQGSPGWWEAWPGGLSRETRWRTPGSRSTWVCPQLHQALSWASQFPKHRQSEHVTSINTYITISLLIFQGYGTTQPDSKWVYKVQCLPSIHTYIHAYMFSLEH